ncbi:hypothetical protein H181DRAFT_01868 [Streptomyces sp. WMMB 714]|uniref:hypothetical protein n=1 Tax=Streptomyces sp. WMMB 714 TaxID=1286822 RepID=UPI000698D491|nr:hypothetical protein [Streptomyces sp. WMMB 714]SCK24601.1 hypothetical protein H181DRAFT_01868 [Streptomyces sp. WMMB 714]
MSRGGRIATAVVAAIGLLGAGYGTAQAGMDPSPDKSSTVREAQPPEEPAGDDDDFESTLELTDGRKVHVRLVEGTGVQERHTTGESSKWSRWQTLYKTKTDRCQDVDLREEEGTVSLIADFGTFCYDGEPPTESLAGVGTGDLTDWDIDIQKGFDGWRDTTMGGWGETVVFVAYYDGLYTLRWQKGEGFSEMQKPEK